jgi:hypothetical protein
MLRTGSKLSFVQLVLRLTIYNKLYNPLPFFQLLNLILKKFFVLQVDFLFWVFYLYYLLSCAVILCLYLQSNFIYLFIYLFTK